MLDNRRNMTDMFLFVSGEFSFFPSSPWVSCEVESIGVGI